MFSAPWLRRAARIAGLGSLLLLGGCDINNPQSALNVSGPMARMQMNLMTLTFWLSVLVLAIVLVWLVYDIIRFRRPKNDDGSLPPQIHGSIPIEIIWTAFPVALLVVISIFSIPAVFATQPQTDERLNPTGNALVIDVIGHQYWWELHYPKSGIVTANELHIPTGKRVVLNLVSADVIHQFWVPSLAGKTQLIPNQTNKMWLEADKPGIYYGQCAFLCGPGHAYMRFRVIAESPADYQAWVNSFKNAATEQVSTDAEVQKGRALFKSKGCAGCHAIAGYATGNIGPNLTNFGLRTGIAADVLENTPANVEKWIKDPDSVKPSFMPNLGLSDAEAEALTAYLESLGKQTKTAEVSARTGGSNGDR